MSEALIGGDMFSNFLQERPEENVSKKEGKKNTSRQMDPRNISSSCAANDSGLEENCKGHYTAKIRRAKKERVVRKKKKSVSFLWAVFEANREDVIVSILHDRAN